MKNEALKKLTEEMEKDKNPHLQVVGQYLVEHLEQNPSDAQKILSEGKSLVKSIEAMKKEAEKKKVGNYAVLSDQEGFDIVLKYFEIDKKANVIQISDNTSKLDTETVTITNSSSKEKKEVLFDVKLEDFL